MLPPSSPLKYGGNPCGDWPRGQGHTWGLFMSSGDMATELGLGTTPECRVNYSHVTLGINSLVGESTQNDLSWGIWGRGFTGVGVGATL